MECDFREIFRMSCRKGVQSILDATQSRRVDAPESAAAFIESLSTMPDHFHRAMATWLDHRGGWREANRHYGGDAPGWWRKRKHMGHRPARNGCRQPQTPCRPDRHLVSPQRRPGQPLRGGIIPPGWDWTSTSPTLKTTRG